MRKPVRGMYTYPDMAGREGWSETKQASKKQLESKHTAQPQQTSLENAKFQTKQTEKTSVLSWFKPHNNKTLIDHLSQFIFR